VIGMEWLLAPIVALSVWWFGTGLVMWLDGLPRRSYPFSLLAVSAVAVAALMCISATAHRTGVADAYGSFVCAVLVWSWNELTFLTGWLTGPRREACSAPEPGRQRLQQAVAAIAWHELAILALGGVIAWLSWGSPQPVALWTYGVLWLMRLSAKFNLYLGVRNRGEEFLPPHLAYLGSYFRDQRSNVLLPFSLAAGSVAAVLMALQIANSSGGSRVGWLLVLSLLVLALLEHLLMVLPVQPSALWRWAMRSQDGQAPRRAH
jgi:putative photosynthetic complex assembly protein 2